LDLKLVKSEVNITNSSVVDYCATPPIRLAFNCAGVVAMIGASIAAPNPVIIGSVVHFLTEIYENC